MDNRLVTGKPLKSSFLRKHKLNWYASGDNDEYLAEDLLGITASEEAAFLAAAQTAYDLLRDTAASIVGSPKLMNLCGIPPAAHDLMRWSVNHEWNDYLVGRFDFAGGLDGLPIKLIEFNADTCSLLPETTTLQPEMISRARQRAGTNLLLSSLSARLKTIAKHPELSGTAMLLADLGHDDDFHNAHVVARAAKDARWESAQHMLLERVIFDPDAAMMVDTNGGESIVYDVLFKFFPWEFAFVEEPELGEVLAEMVMKRLVKVLNPAWSMLLQSKALLALAWERYPQHPLLLETTLSTAALKTNHYVRKPFFGRAGENIALFQGGPYPTEETEGHYGDTPQVYQAMAQFNADSDQYRYQPSVFFTDRPVAVAVRRQDDAIMDDDAEFIATFLQ
ncbi:MAG: glutathionylspermidine synthase family protein [Bacteroidota bacterium]